MTGAVALALLGGGAAFSAPPASGAASLAALRRAAAPGAEEKGLARLARDPQVQQALRRFSEGVLRAKDAETALRDPRVAGVLLPALGLADALDKPGLAARALLSDPKDRSSLAARLGDPRWREAAASLNLSARGLEALRDPAVQETLTKGFLRHRWRLGQDEGAPGVSDALYLRERLAERGPPSVWEVLGDPVLRRVVTGALGLPQQLVVQSVEAQARAVTARLDLSKLSDPRQVAKLGERYLMARAAPPPTSFGSLPGLSLLA